MGEGRAIGVRYCGGCNPRYDRTAAVRTLKELLPNWWGLERYEADARRDAP